MLTVREKIAKLWIGKNVFVLWIGQIISQAGDSLYQIALIWLILEITGSSAITGVAGMSAYLPTLLFGLFAGVISDRFNRRTIMIVADLARALLVLIIPLCWFLGKISISLLVGITFCIACFSTLFNPARDSLLPDIVLEDRLELSNSLIQTSWQLAMFLGPFAAGLLIPVIGLIHLFELDSITFLVSMTCIIAITSSTGIRAKTPAHHTSQSIISSFLEGFRYCWKNIVIRQLLFITAIYNIFLMGIPIIATPVFVKLVLDNRAETYAWLQAVYAGGMVIGAPLAAFLSKKMKKGKLMLIGIILDGMSFCPLFFAKTRSMALILMFIHSIFISFILVPRATLIQRVARRQMWGRVFAMLSVAVTGTSSISCLIVGWLCELIDVRWVIMIFGIASALVGFAGLWMKRLSSAK